jgi:hypothetical protein
LDELATLGQSASMAQFGTTAVPELTMELPDGDTEEEGEKEDGGDEDGDEDSPAHRGRRGAKESSLASTDEVQDLLPPGSLTTHRRARAGEAGLALGVRVILTPP